LVFAGFMLVLFIVGSVFFLISSILLIVGIVRKRRGMKFKVLRIIAIIVLYCIALVCVIIPIGWVSIVRTGNQDHNYRDTGVYLSSTPREVYADEQFYYDGDLYKAVKEDDFYGGSGTELSEALANAIGEKTFWDKFFNYSEDITVYSVKNDSGYTILAFGPGSSKKYCKDADRDKIPEYYRSLPEYEYEHSVFNTETSTLSHAEMDFNKDVFNELRSKYSSGEEKIIIDGDDAIDDYYIYQNSPDKLYSRSASVLITEDSAYVIALTHGSNAGIEYTCYRLSAETADFVRNALGF
jgi:hypothetical protein